jgi:hypothetical protein
MLHALRDQQIGGKAPLKWILTRELGIGLTSVPGMVHVAGHGKIHRTFDSTNALLHEYHLLQIQFKTDLAGL